MKLLIDMDGVLVDFVRGVFKFYGRDDIPYRDVRWGFYKKYFDPVTFWSLLTFDFWAGLNPIPEGRSLFNACVSIFGKENVCFCTSPSSNPGCIDGKIAWIESHYPDFRRQFMITPVKHFAAHRSVVLIDDDDKNCDEFVQHGGRAVLVPAPWNRSANLLRSDDSYDVAVLVKEVRTMLSTRCERGPLIDL